MATTRERVSVNCMCDLETLGTRPGCKVLSVAVVPFPVEGALEPFYQRIDKESYPITYHESSATIAWWAKQSEEARVEAFSGVLPYVTVLRALSVWMQQLPGRCVLWGNGSDFDNAILQEMYHKESLLPGWSHLDNRCYRTLKNLCPQVPYIKPKVAHNAFYDAQAQAVHAEEILRMLVREGVL